MGKFNSWFFQPTAKHVLCGTHGPFTNPAVSWHVATSRWGVEQKKVSAHFSSARRRPLGAFLLSGLRDQGVSPHFFVTRESPP